jgi:hypothetical protein
MLNDELQLNIFDHNDKKIIKYALESLYHWTGNFEKILISSNISIKSYESLEARSVFEISALYDIDNNTINIYKFTDSKATFFHELIRFIDFREFLRFKGIKNYMEIKHNNFYFSLVDNYLMSEKRALPNKISRMFKEYCNIELQDYEYFARAIEQYIFTEKNRSDILKDRPGYCPENEFCVLKVEAARYLLYLKNYFKVLNFSSNELNFVSYTEKFDELFPGFNELNTETEENLLKVKYFKSDLEIQKMISDRDETMSKDIVK